MKIQVYQCVEDKYIEMEVLAQYKYIGETDELSFINGKIYIVLDMMKNIIWQD